jgi:molybdate transport system ATP-binding protein
VTLLFDAAVVRGSFRLQARVEVAPGEVIAVLGPNGAGKSTMLRSVAGLIGVDSGTVSLDSVVLDAPEQGVFVPAEQRGLGLVFQDHRLFPHLKVIDNVAFGLRSRGVPRRVAREAAGEWIERLGLAPLADRHPRQLSGGQAQRVALARALACSPGALLLDEPLAALDVQTRAEVQAELRDHLGAFEGPVLLVTHDPLEALLLAGRIVVLEAGEVAQEGSPAEISSRPVTPYVARLVGVNLYRGRAVDGSVSLDGGGVLAAADAPPGRVFVAVRPTAFTVHVEPPHGLSARTVWSGKVRALTPLADRIRLTVDGAQTAAVDVTASAVAELALAPGRAVWLTAKATDVTAYRDVAR